MKAQRFEIKAKQGMFIGHFSELMPKDLNPESGTVRILNGKGAKARTVGLDPASFAFIGRWLDVRSARGLTGRKPVFCTLKGEPMATAYVRGLFKRLGKKAGIEKRVHPHGLRHTCAAEMAAEGIPVNVIQAQLGHSSLATTSRYLDHIAPQQLIDATSARTWNI